MVTHPRTKLSAENKEEFDFDVFRGLNVTLLEIHFGFKS